MKARHIILLLFICGVLLMSGVSAYDENEVQAKINSLNPQMPADGYSAALDSIMKDIAGRMELQILYVKLSLDVNSCATDPDSSLCSNKALLGKINDIKEDLFQLSSADIEDSTSFPVYLGVASVSDDSGGSGGSYDSGGSGGSYDSGGSGHRCSCLSALG